MKRSLVALLVVVGCVVLVRSARCETYQRTLPFITTGNGHGFQWFDVNQHKIVGFLEHPYRYLQPNPSDYKAEGLGRRNLAYDVYFGIRAPGGAGWLNAPDQADPPEYVDQDNIIRVPSTLKGVTTEQFFFAPFGYEGNAMIAILHAPGATDGALLLNFHMGARDPQDQTVAQPNGETTGALTDGAIYETGPGGGVMVYVPLSGATHEDCQGVYGKIATGLGDMPGCSGNDIVPGIQKTLDGSGWFAVAIGYRDAPTGQEQQVAQQMATELKTWGGNRAPDQILSDAKAEFEAWRKPVPTGVGLCNADEIRLWRQSETVLRMGQIREANTATRHNNGMLLASLPPGEWHTSWVRDATYAVVALSRTGHFAEAKAALEFWLNAGPVGRYSSYVNNQSYRISLTRYFGTGEEECDWNNNGPNVELDGWGLVLWAARQYVSASGDKAFLNEMTPNGKVYDVIHNNIAQPLEGNLESSGIVKGDSSIWEVHQPGKHYAYTTLTAARGFCDMGALAAAANGPDAAHWAQLSQKAMAGINAVFLDRNGAIAGNLEGLAAGQYYDASVADVFNWSLLTDYTSKTAKATISLFNFLRVASGGFKRNNDGLSSYDNNEWILVDLRISDALRRAGKGDEADGYLATIVAKASVNFYILPELFNAVAADGQLGKYTGSIPMVGYGGGAYLMTIMDRSGVIEPNDCGDGKGAQGTAWQCPGGNVDTDGGAPAGGGGGSGGGGADGGAGGSNGLDGIPRVPACYCDFGGATSTGAGALLLLLVPLFAIALRLQRRRG